MLIGCTSRSWCATWSAVTCLAALPLSFGLAASSDHGGDVHACMLHDCACICDDGARGVRDVAASACSRHPDAPGNAGAAGDAAAGVRAPSEEGVAANGIAGVCGKEGVDASSACSRNVDAGGACSRHGDAPGDAAVAADGAAGVRRAKVEASTCSPRVDAAGDAGVTAVGAAGVSGMNGFDVSSAWSRHVDAASDVAVAADRAARAYGVRVDASASSLHIDAACEAAGVVPIDEAPSPPATVPRRTIAAPDPPIRRSSRSAWAGSGPLPMSPMSSLARSMASGNDPPDKLRLCLMASTRSLSVGAAVGAQP